MARAITRTLITLTQREKIRYTQLDIDGNISVHRPPTKELAVYKRGSMPQQETPGAYLVIQKGSLVGKRVELWKECTTIGRSRDSDIFLEDITVHRKQARILITTNGYLLRDDHGSGDSFVNGQPISEQALINGDQLQFGNTLITFYANEATRPFQLPSSRGRELYIGKGSDPLTSTIIARLHITNPGSVINTIELLPGMSIGRSRECDIFLEDLSVSRVHATIKEAHTGEYEIIDNNSATGTFVNGQKVARCSLREGDRIQIGNTNFTFQITPTH